MKLSTEAVMKRTTIAVFGAVALMSAACAEPEPSILVTGHVPLIGSEEEGVVTGCAAPGSISDIEVSYGSVIINLQELDDANAPFQLGLLLENRLVDSSTYSAIGHDQNQRLDQNHIEIQGYEVTFDSDREGFGSLGPDKDGALRYESTGLVTTDGALWVGVELFYPFEIENWQSAFQIASDGDGSAIVPTFAEVQVVGETVGGGNVKSNILTIPIQVCDGCNLPSTPICVATE